MEDTAMVNQSPEPENGRETASSTDATVTVIIIAHKGTEDVAGKAWDKMLPGLVKKIITSQAATLVDVLPDLIADEDIADKFVLVPAGCIPCAPVSFEELHTPLVYVDGQGKRHYDRLPVVLDKADLVERLSSNGFSPDTVMESICKAKGRAIEGSFREGNLLTPVLRGNPCEHIVMEALIRKKYLICSAEGLTAITQLLQDTMLAE